MMALLLLAGSASLLRPSEFTAGQASIMAWENEARRVASSMPPVASNANDPPRPAFPRKFSSLTVYTAVINGTAVPVHDQTLVAQDDTNKRLAKQSQIRVNAFVPAAFKHGPLSWINSTQLLQGDFFGIRINEVTLDASMYKARYYDMFGWVAAATFGGEVQYRGEAAQKWTLATSGNVLTLLVAGCGNRSSSASECRPLCLTQLVNGAPGRPPAYNISYEYLSFTPGGEIKGVWSDFNMSDYTDPAPCPPTAGTSEDGATATSDAYIFHPRASFDVVRQDIGDLQGDVFFVCMDMLTNQSLGTDHHYEWITHYNLTYSPRLGQYQNCNGYPPVCLGAEDFWVGHEAALGLGTPKGGQCQANPLTGEWWSLPKGGQCAPGTTPDGVHCTWTHKRIKSIDSACLFDERGYVDACKADGRAPFAAAQRVFQAAFESDDPAAGGCPDIG